MEESLTSQMTPMGGLQSSYEPLDPGARKQDENVINGDSDAALQASLLAGGVAVLLLLPLLYTLYRCRRRSSSAYDAIPDATALERQRASRCSQASILSAKQSRPIDFVLPASPASPSSPDSADYVPLWARLALLDPGPTLLGGLNPELYRVDVDREEGASAERDFPDGNVGRVWVGARFDRDSERLLVHLLQVRNLPSRVLGCNNCCDPFVRIHILPDERRYVQSKMKKKTCNPKFEENFLFQMPGGCVAERVLRVTVLDSDRGKHYNVLGHALFPLAHLDLAADHLALRWKDLVRDADQAVPCDAGELLVSLCYNENLERLTVTVCEAKGLKLPEGHNSLDTQVKLVLSVESRQVKSKKTQGVKRSDAPKFNESFHFRLSQKQLSAASLLLQITCLSAGPRRDKAIGRVVFGSYMFVRGRPLEHWNEAVTAGHRQIRHWQKLSL